MFSLHNFFTKYILVCIKAKYIQLSEMYPIGNVYFNVIRICVEVMIFVLKFHPLVEVYFMSFLGADGIFYPYIQ